MSDDEFRGLVKKAYTDVFLTVYHLYKYTHERFHEVETKLEAFLKDYEKTHQDIRKIVDALVVRGASNVSGKESVWKTLMGSIALFLGAFLGIFFAMLVLKWAR